MLQSVLTLSVAVSLLGVARPIAGQASHVSRQLAIPPPAAGMLAAAPAAPTTYADVQVAYMFTDDGDFQDGAILGYSLSTILFESGDFSLPILGNFDAVGVLKALRNVETLAEAKEKAQESIADVAATRRGAVIGLFPYWESNFLTIHGSTEIRAQSFAGTEETDAETRWLYQGRGSVGIELHKDVPGGRRVFGGVAVAGHVFQSERYEGLFDEDRSDLFLFEAHFGFPLPSISGKYAVFGEYVRSLSDTVTDVEGFRLGIVVVP